VTSDYDKARREAGWCQAYQLRTDSGTLTVWETEDRTRVRVCVNGECVDLNLEQWSVFRYEVHLNVRRPKDDEPQEPSD
jgi:hypothetical protein